MIGGMNSKQTKMKILLEDIVKGGEGRVINMEYFDKNLMSNISTFTMNLTK